MNVDILKLIDRPINCHAFNRDKTELAICPNNNEIHLFTKSHKNGKWQLSIILKEHDQLITGIDWWSGPEGSDKIVSCSEDRNSFVWSRTSSTDEWRPVLVLLRFRRAATCVRWSPNGKKFAVGGVEGIIAVGYFEPENDWWVCKHIKKTITGPVLSIAWHPNSLLLASGTLDAKVHVVSTFIKAVDQDYTPVGWSTLDQRSFDEELVSISSSYGWIHGVSISPSGNYLAWCTQASQVEIYNFEQKTQSAIMCDGLPLKGLCFVSDAEIVLASFIRQPYLITHSGQNWSFKGALRLKSSAMVANKTGLETSKFSGALQKFKQFDLNSDANKSKDAPPKQSEHVHQNIISEISCPIESLGQSFTSAGLDGRIVIWSGIASQGCC